MRQNICHHCFVKMISPKFSEEKLCNECAQVMVPDFHEKINKPKERFSYIFLDKKKESKFD